MIRQTQLEYEVEDGRLVIYTNINAHLYNQQERVDELVERLTALFGYEVTVHRGVVTIWKNGLHDDEFPPELIQKAIDEIDLTYVDFYAQQPA